MNTDMKKLAMEEEINEKRQEMIAIALKYGLTNEKTLKSSQELDSLLNKYMRFFRRAKIREFPFLAPNIKTGIVCL